MEPVKIGVLALQGSVEEHLNALAQLSGVSGVPVKKPEELEQVQGLILPGGESTTISKLLHAFGLFEPLRRRITSGMPVWGTCAGLILLADQVEGEASHLGVMDMIVRRNAFGRQMDSFSISQVVPAFSPEPLELVFIRAPWIVSVGEPVQVLCEVKGHIAAARQGNCLATSFHPELTGDTAVHEYFAGMVRRQPPWAD